MCCVIDNDVKLTSRIECFALQTKLMDIDDDDEYMNAAAVVVCNEIVLAW